jgi:torulene dioxygenase
LTEQRGPLDVPVTGVIPSWAAGSLYRTGPGQRTIENTPKGTHQISHWFDGLAHTHRFDLIPDPTLPDGACRVAYSSRRQSESLVRYIQAHGASRLTSFGQRGDPCIGLLGKFMTTFMTMFQRRVLGGASTKDADTENISVAVHTDVPGLRAADPERPPTGKSVASSVESRGHRALPATTWLTTDTSTLKQMDPLTLEPIGIASQRSLHPDLRGPMSCAHAQRDPDNGDLFNFNLEPGRFATYRIFRVSAETGKTDILGVVAKPGVSPSYVHSFFLTENFVVLCLPSAHVGWGGAKILWERNVIDAILPFDESQAVKWFVVDRRHGKGVVAEFESPAAFFFHSINAYEEAGEDGETVVVCDLVEYPNFDIVRTLYYDAILNVDGAGDKNFRDPAKTPALMPRLARYRLPLTAASAPRPPARPREPPPPPPAQAHKAATILGPHAGELPTINPAYATRRHRYAYGLASRGLSTLVDTIVKTDVDTGAAVLWNNPRGHTPGEAIFVARPGAAREDDGVLLSVVIDGAAATSYLLCLDAGTMEEMGRAEMGFAVAMGFHGCHYR